MSNLMKAALVAVLFCCYAQAKPHSGRYHRGTAAAAAARNDDDKPQVDVKDPAAIQGQIERMVERMKRVGVEDSTIEMADQLDDIETSLENSDPTLHSEIVATREELCAERGFEGHQLGECERFMHRACGPGAHSLTRGPAAQVPQHKCEHFFGKRKASPAAKVRLDARRANTEAAAPSPAPGPAPGPLLFGGKIDRDLPDQGFSGEFGKHEDRKSSIGDWGHEFGISSGHRTARQICAEHPNNEWCRIHGYYHARQRSEANPSRAACALVAVLAAYAFA